MAKRSVVLHIDDDARVREAIAAILTRAGFAVEAAANGLDALEHVATFGAPALVLLDVTMPVMDGRQLMAERRKWASLAHVPFVALTASVGLDAAELGLAEVLQKPVDAELLLAVVRRYAGTERSGFYSATPQASSAGRERRR